LERGADGFAGGEARGREGEGGGRRGEDGRAFCSGSHPPHPIWSGLRWDVGCPMIMVMEMEMMMS
jgi:hypothetical protein